MTVLARAAQAALLQRALAALSPSAPAPQQLAQLVGQGLGELPLPGGGHTLQRWQALAEVARHDLSLAKLYEGHTDALAILSELGGLPRPDDCRDPEIWSVWAAEAPQGRTVIQAQPQAQPQTAPASGTEVRLGGHKCWCSGAACATHALLTAWWPDGRGPQLVSVHLRQAGVQVLTTHWHAVGMAGSASLDVAFDNARALLVGEPGAYLARPGFWQGGAGIAACWYGGTLAIAHALHAAAVPGTASDSHTFRLAALGQVDVALRATAALLREAAAWVDAFPEADASAVALRVRLRTEHSAQQVLDEVGRALGATPFCRDARFARAAADLPVFIRQSHGPRDFKALAERLIDTGPMAWPL